MFALMILSVAMRRSRVATVNGTSRPSPHAASWSADAKPRSGLTEIRVIASGSHTANAIAPPKKTHSAWINALNTPRTIQA